MVLQQSRNIAGVISAATGIPTIDQGGGIFGKAFGFGKKKKGPTRQQLRNMALGDMYASIHGKAAYTKQAAEKYGYHPLTLLGAGTPQISAPVYSGGDDSSSSMGQNIAEAVAKGASQYITGKAQKKANDLALENAALQNELLKAQITSINNPAKAGSAYSNDQRVLDETNPKVDVVNDENVTRNDKERGLTAGSENPPPAGKRFTVGNTPYGEVYITLPPSGQADEYGEVYGAIKGLEYLAKRGYVHYARGTYRYGKKLRAKLTGKKSTGKGGW
jgi:hypothetical protein